MLMPPSPDAVRANLTDATALGHRSDRDIVSHKHPCNGWTGAEARFLAILYLHAAKVCLTSVCHGPVETKSAGGLTAISPSCHSVPTNRTAADQRDFTQSGLSIAKGILGMLHRSNSTLSLAAMAITLVGASACSSTDGPINGPLNPAVPASDPPIAEPNSNLTILTPASPAVASARDQDFEVASAFITTRDNVRGGEDFIASSTSDFDNPTGFVEYDRATRSLTFSIDQGTVNIAETFGPILLFEPPELLGFDDDRLAITLSSVPELFFQIVPGNVTLPNGAQTLLDLRNDPGAADVFVADLVRISGGEESNLGSEIDSDTASAILESLNTVADTIFAGDFIPHLGDNGSTYSPFKIRDNNPNVEPSYVILGLWNTLPLDNQGSDRTLGASVFGLQTPEAEIPAAGTASYDTTIGGYVVRNGDRVFLTGSVNLTADFSTRQVRYDVNTVLATPDRIDTLFTPFVDLRGSGVIESNRFDGDLVGVDDPSLRGTVDGAFFGPEAVEVGGTLRFGNDEIQAVGGFVGTREGDGTP